MSKLNSSYGFISLLYSISDNPLCLWSKHVSTDGRIRRVQDEMLNGDKVIEIRGPEDSPISTNISCPGSPEDLLNIRLPVLAIVLKNLKARVQIAFQVALQEFKSYEEAMCSVLLCILVLLRFRYDSNDSWITQLLDEENVRRKFILSTRDGEETSAVEPEAARLTLKLDEGWNLLEINLRTLCRTTYCTEYRALQRLIIYPNCRVRRIYLQDRHYEHDETPVELCQAFFDMYMLKWGIHFVEKSCQTNETIPLVNSDETLGEERAASQPENRLPAPKPKIGKSVSDETSGLKRRGKRLTKRKEKSSSDNADNNDDKKAKPLTKKPRTKKRKESNAKIQKDANSSALASTPKKIDESLKSAADSFGKSDSKFSNSSSIDAKDPIIVSSIGRIFPELKSINSLKGSLAPVAIPREVEAEAKEATRIVETKRSKLLTTDETVGRFLELRHVINKKMLENFGVRGLTMTEVELSIYNSIHRRNSYGQGNLVEKHRTSVDKACHVDPACNANEESGK